MCERAKPTNSSLNTQDTQSFHSFGILIRGCLLQTANDRIQDAAICAG